MVPIRSYTDNGAMVSINMLLRFDSNKMNMCFEMRGTWVRTHDFSCFLLVHSLWYCSGLYATFYVTSGFRGYTERSEIWDILRSRHTFSNRMRVLGDPTELPAGGMKPVYKITGGKVPFSSQVLEVCSRNCFSRMYKWALDSRMKRASSNVDTVPLWGSGVFRMLPILVPFRAYHALYSTS